MIIVPSSPCSKAPDGKDTFAHESKKSKVKYNRVKQKEDKIYHVITRERKKNCYPSRRRLPKRQKPKLRYPEIHLPIEHRVRDLTQKVLTLHQLK